MSAIEGGRGESKIGPNLQKDRSKKLPTWGRGVSKIKKEILTSLMDDHLGKFTFQKSLVATNIIHRNTVCKLKLKIHSIMPSNLTKTLS